MASYSNLNALNKKLLKKDRFELLVKSDGDTVIGSHIKSVTVEMPRTDSPSVLKFEILKEAGKDIDYGNPVKFSIDGKVFWFGYVFTIESSEGPIMTCTCYDQLRYLKFKDTYKYEENSYSDILKKICSDRSLLVGTIEDTGYKIPRRIEEDKELFEIVQYASDLTTAITGNIFVLYDEAGKICLKNSDNMKVDNMVVHEQLGEGYSYTGSIDENTYNRIKVDLVDQNTNKVTPIVAESKDTISKWGILQWYAQTTEPRQQVEAKTKQLLEVLNRPTRAITFNNLFGHPKVRGGSQVPVQLKTRDVEIDGYMLVESVTHNFTEGVHTMDITAYSKDFLPDINTDNIFIYEKKEQENKAGGSAGTGGGLIAGTNEEKIWSWFRSRGYSKEVAAGIMGNMKQESGLSPARYQNGGGRGRGLIQWEIGGGRFEQLSAYAKSKGKLWTDLEVQLEFVEMELKGSKGADSYSNYLLRTKYGLTFEQFKQLNNVIKACDVFEGAMERAGIPMMQYRHNYAREIYQKFSNWQPVQPQVNNAVEAVLAFAVQRKGMPYNSGSLRMSSTHDDCSSLVDKSLRKAGYPNTMGQDLTTRNIHRDSRFYEVPISQARRGDVLHRAGHVAFYMGNNQTFEAMDYGVPTNFSTKNNRFNKAYRIRI